jgi:hypothetical protein
MDLNRVLTRNADSAYRVYDGKATIVLPGRGEVNVLNPIGSLVWESIDGARNLEQIADRIMGEYQISRDQAVADLIEFITDLERHGMVS